MPIEFCQGDIFSADVDALVNAVNTVGVMGKGIALQFRTRYPEMYESYHAECVSGRLRPGKVHVFERNSRPRFIINFPTKIHWRDPSKIQWIEAGLARLFGVTAAHLGLTSLAIPALGCKNGHLDWETVKSCIQKWYWIFDDVVGSMEVKVYEPLMEKT